MSAAVGARVRGRDARRGTPRDGIEKSMSAGRLRSARGSVPEAMNLVYDVGMNNGDDSAYYLAKGLRVVGIEANTALCNLCTDRFATEVKSGQLVIINCAVGAAEGVTDFYIHRKNPLLSTLVPPRVDDENWSPQPVSARKLSSLIEEQGDAYYVKIDVECMDHVVLGDLLKEGIVPPFISAESHQIDVFCHLVAMGYTGFKLVDGRAIPHNFADHEISAVNGRRARYRFAVDSAGPFGEDLPGPWVSKDVLLHQLLLAGFGWKDIHATTTAVGLHHAFGNASVWSGDRSKGFRQNCAELLPSLWRGIFPKQELADYVHPSFVEIASDFLPSFWRALRRRLR